MRPDLTPGMVLDALVLLCLWIALAAFFLGALAAELSMWRRDCRREGMRRLFAARRRHG